MQWYLYYKPFPANHVHILKAKQTLLHKVHGLSQDTSTVSKDTPRRYTFKSLILLYFHKNASNNILFSTFNVNYTIHLLQNQYSANQIAGLQ